MTLANDPSRLRKKIPLRLVKPIIIITYKAFLKRNDLLAAFKAGLDAYRNGSWEHAINPFKQVEKAHRMAKQHEYNTYNATNIFEITRL